MGTTTSGNDQFHELLKEYSYPLSVEGNDTAARTLRLVGTDKRVLELGCSVGTQSRVLRQDLNCDVTGIEINPAAAEQARSYCSKVIVGNLDELDFDSALGRDKFDVVLCADVLEHLYNPTILLSKVKPLIDTKGYLVASLPNIVHAAVIFEMLRGKFDYRQKGLLDNSHIRFFTRRTIIDSFSAAGFKIDLLERGYARESETEFAIRNIKTEDKQVIEYIRTHNEECFTYHFIVKATPSSDPVDQILSHNAEVERRSLSALATDKEHQLAALERKVEDLRSDIAQIEERIPMRIARWFRVILREGWRNASRNNNLRAASNR